MKLTCYKNQKTNTTYIFKRQQNKQVFIRKIFICKANSETNCQSFTFVSQFCLNKQMELKIKRKRSSITKDTFYIELILNIIEMLKILIIFYYLHEIINI